MVNFLSGKECDKRRMIILRNKTECESNNWERNLIIEKDGDEESLEG